jgi:hypothetical protein
VEVAPDPKFLLSFRLHFSLLLQSFQGLAMGIKEELLYSLGSFMEVGMEEQGVTEIILLTSFFMFIIFCC